MTRSSSTLYFLVFLSVLIRTSAHHAESCNNAVGNFTWNSPYGKNRDTIIGSLTEKVSANGGSYNTSTGQSPNTIYALTFCQFDDAGEIVETVARDLVEECPSQKAAFSWGTGSQPCLIRYSDTPIYGILQTQPTILHDSEDNITMSHAIWLNLTWAVMNQAMDGRSKLTFAKGQATLPDNRPVYSLLQCSFDLSANNCRSCLEEAIAYHDKHDRESQSSGVFNPSCIIRWALSPFPSPSSPAAPPASGGSISKGTLAAIIVAVAAFVVLLFIGCCWSQRRRAQKKSDAVQEDCVSIHEGVTEITSLKSLQFDWDTLLSATNNFSQENKLGEGGFGEVFQGRLPNGKDIAVKRLSQSSGQGVEEFTNEILLVAKLQHRNLVRLLGFCVEGGEKLLVYEFVPKKSLDYFLFDPERSKQLDWPTRYNIILGIARGMLYLHEDSRLRIIHRDLKASNILLDNDLSPKISDFGMARIFQVNQNNASTRRIVGTYGYMSPEYAMHGQFSQKSDVYSFGILLLEIICGKRNNYYFQSDKGEGLTSYAWKHWRGDSPLDLLDSALGESYSTTQVLRCMHICFLCVQEDPANRPTMANIALALSGQILSLPVPREPAFFLQTEQSYNIFGSNQGSDQITSGSVPLSMTGGLITTVYPR